MTTNENDDRSFYDPVKRAEATPRIVCRGNQRKYNRFRPARFGQFYSPEQVAGKLTAMAPAAYGLQIQALENLVRAHVAVHPAVMVSFSSCENIGMLRRRLREIHEYFEDFEVEELALYGKVEERLMKAGLFYDKTYIPENIPPEQV